MPAEVAMPRLLRIGAGVLGTIGDVLATLGLARPLLVTDSFLVRQGYVGRLISALRDAGLPEPRVFAGAIPDPTDASVLEGIAVLRDGSHDCVIGLGGGSSIDTAKAVAVFSKGERRIRDYRAPHVENAPGLPVIAIPTTAGSGSEATRFTIITDAVSNEKMLCVGLAYLPVAALVDFELSMTMPRRLTADTGIDALTHAIEAYVSRRANAVSDGFALRAMQLIAPNLRVVASDPANRTSREAMMQGSTMAGMAFSNASVALVHGMSRPIGAHFHVPHGLSNAMLLPLVTAYSVPGSPERYADCARNMAIVDAREPVETAVTALLRELESLNSALDVPTPKDFGIARDAWHAAIETMAEQAMASGSPSNNPIVPGVDEIKELYRKLYP